MDKKPLSYFLELIEEPICICDGGTPQFSLDLKLHDLFNKLKINHERAFHLFLHPERYDLSKFKTLAFYTQDDYYRRPELKKIFDFDKSNLRCVIVESQRAFNLVKDETEKLGIVVVGFDRQWEGFINMFPPEEHIRHPFFDPKTEKLHHSWR